MARTMWRTRSIVSDMVSKPISGAPRAEAEKPKPVVKSASKPACSARRAERAS